MKFPINNLSLSMPIVFVPYQLLPHVITLGGKGEYLSNMFYILDLSGRIWLYTFALFCNVYGYA